MGYTYVMSKAEMVDSRACLQALLHKSTSMEVSLQGYGHLYIADPSELDDWLDDDSALPEANYTFQFFKECNDAMYL